MKKYILFDLDGTVTNPKEGITKSIQYALHHMGIEVEDLDSLCRHIGPPLKYGFMDFWGFSEEEADRGVSLYREYFTVTGIYQNHEYEGMKEFLECLARAGKKLIVATSKPEEFARLIMEHFHLEQYFQDICGACMDGRRDKKGDVIRYALKKNRITDPDQVVMVGDRFYDIEGARENNIDSIGVLYGFGSLEELTGAGAGAIAKTLKDLKTILLEG